MLWDIDEEPCDVFCNCDKCIKRREYKEKGDRERQHREMLCEFGFDEYDEDLPLSKEDKKYYVWKGIHRRKKILGIAHITEKAILFKFNGYNAWFPKSVIVGLNCSSFRGSLDEEYYLNKIVKRKTIEYVKEFNITKIYAEDYINIAVHEEFYDWD